MIQTIVAFHGEDVQDTVCGILERNGIPVRYRCRTGAEVIRAVGKMGGGVVVCGYKLPDMTADELCGILKDEAMILVAAKPVYLDMCEAEGIFRLAAPVRASELAGTVGMLVDLNEQRVRARVAERSGEEKALIAQAKAILMERSAMTEEQAHRFLQRRSMETSSRMADTARLIIASAE